MSLPNIFSRSIALMIVAFVLSLQVNVAAQVSDRGMSVTGSANGNSLDGRGKLWGVVIGVSKYRNLSPRQQLSFAHRDAEDFAAFLRTPAGGGFPASQLRVLVNQEATLAAVRAELGTMLPRSAQPDDVVIIFFAGHGVVEGAHDGYLLMHDSDPQNLYSTALQLSELDRIICERIHARNVILITDACHSGQLGWASRSTKDSAVLVNRYLSEVGKSGKGIFRLLASRADELSYEDKKWGGGHGVFTYHLLEGLKGLADRDHDGVVRATELLEYLSEVVPKATQSLQHPQAAGTLDSKLPLSIAKNPAPAATPTATPKAETRVKTVRLEILGAANSEVYIDKTLRGRIGQNGALVIDHLNSGKHEVVVQVPGGEKSVQNVTLEKERTVLNVNKTARSIAKPPSLSEQIKQALVQGQTENALRLYEQLLRVEPNDPQRAKVETALGVTMESIGQKVMTEYLQSSLTKIDRRSFRQGADAYKWLKTINAGQLTPQQELKYLFCEGRALIEEGQAKDALGYLEKALALDPKAAYVWNAIGLAADQAAQVERAVDAYKKALKLTPEWNEPQYYLGAIYLRQGKTKQAEQALTQVVRSDPNSIEPRFLLVRLWRTTKQWQKAETEALTVLRVLEINPKEYYSSLYAETWYELAQIYEANKRYQNAVDAYEKVIKLSPGRNDRDQLAAKSKKLRELIATPAGKA